MRKGVTAYQNIRLLKWCATAGIRCHWNLIYGFPGEPAAEYARMADLVLSLVHLDSPRLTPLRLDRFSPYHERPHEHGIAIGPPLPHYPLLYPIAPELLADLAYSFELRRLDGSDPEAYVGPLRKALLAWDEALESGSHGSLRYVRRADAVVVHDRRPGLDGADYTFDGLEGAISLACADGATAAQAREAAGRAGVTVADVTAYLDELAEQRLVYAEAGRYLALALPAVP